MSKQSLKKQERIQKIKEELLSQIETSPYLGVVGRIVTWLKDKYSSSYPFSCTVYNVEDSMEEGDGIEKSWLYTSKGLRFGAGVALNFSDLRPSGSNNGKGLVSSGPVPFIPIYSAINGTLRRGGVYKNGAVVCYLSSNHPDLLDFLNLSPSDIPWAKRALYISDDPTSSDFLLNHPHLDKILNAVRNGTLWLAKKQWDKNGNRLYSNVCLEILLKSRGTCTLSHVNLGQCTIKSLRTAFRNSMKFLCKLHSITGAGQDNYYLSTKEDRQVGLGVFGLANLLARYKITYKEFTDCLTEYLEAYAHYLGNEQDLLDQLETTYAFRTVNLVHNLFLAYQDAAKIAKQYKMERAFTVAPTASCSFRYTDYKGYTTSAEISPPICHPKTKILTRDSDTFGQTEWQYPLNVETAEQVGWETYYSLAKAWQQLMDTTELGHSISFNIWNECPVDREWIADWLQSPLKTTYYRMQPKQDFVDKTAIDVGIKANFNNDGFITDADNNPIKETENNIDALDFLFELMNLRDNSVVDDTDQEVQMCSIEAMKQGLDCTACAE